MALQPHATAWHRARPALAFGHFAPVARGAMPLRAAELYVRLRNNHCSQVRITEENKVTDPLLAGGKLVWDMVAGLLGAHDKTKVDLFNNHVEPLQQRIAPIHQNYTRAFLELRSELRLGRFKLKDAVSFLEQRRLDFQYERDLASKVASRLSEAERRPVRPEAWSDLQRYCTSIDHYLSSPYQFHRITHFASLLESAMRAGGHDYLFHRTIVEFQVESTSQMVPSEFVQQVDALIEHDLPSAIAAVNDAYARLRTRLL